MANYLSSVISFICLYDRVIELVAGTHEAVELMGRGRREDGLVGPHDGRGEVVVLGRVVHPDEAHALCLIVSLLLWVVRRGLLGKKYLRGMRLFHLSRTSSVKKSAVLFGANDSSRSNVVIFWETM